MSSLLLFNASDLLIQPDPEQYRLFVGPDVNNLQPYISSSQTLNNIIIRNGYCSLFGCYFGSSTRMGPVGTVFNSTLHQYPPIYSNIQGKHIRIMRGNENLYDVFVTGEQFRNHSNDVNFSVNLNNGVVVFLRDLHRFDDYPFEISGVRFLI
jgi:hypothetical protein